MGGIFGTLSSMDSFSYSTFSSSNLKIDESASYSTIGASAAQSSMTDSEKQQASDFDSVTKSKQIFNVLCLCAMIKRLVHLLKHLNISRSDWRQSAGGQQRGDMAGDAFWRPSAGSLLA